MTEKELKQRQLIQLKEILTIWFTQEELEDLSFDLGIDFVALGGRSKGGNIRNLLMMLSRRGQLEKLVDGCNEIRPEIDWGLFTHLSYVEPAPQIPVSEAVKQEGYRFLLSMVGILLIVIVAGSLATAYYFTRTSQPVSAEPNLIIQVPVRGTVSREPVVIIRSSPFPTPTNVVITAVPVANVGGRSEERHEANEEQEQPVAAVTEAAPTATPPQLQDPIAAKVTDTYQEAPLEEANVRSGPGIDYVIVTQLQAHNPVEIYAYANNAYGTPWFKIGLGEGQFGWISSILIDVNAVSLEDIPLDTTITLQPTATPAAEETPSESAATN